MPKRKPKNAFIVFSEEFREEQKKKGITYKNMQDLVIAAAPVWDKLPESSKAKYKKNTNAEVKYTSTGLSFAEVDQKQKEETNAQQSELKEIKNIVELGALNGSISSNDFYVMDVNYFCLTPKGFVICESTIVRFNLLEGIIDCYHEMVNPGSIPTGYASDAMKESKILGIDVPFDNEDASDYVKILAHIIDYLRLNNKDSRLPPLFTMPNKIAPVEDFIQQMCEIAGQDETLFRVYKLPQLFYQLANVSNKGGFPKESLALDQLNTLRFLLLRGQACDHHEPIDKLQHCTMSHTKCWAYTILDHCCPLFDIQLEAGKHLPPDLDLQKIQDYQEDLINVPRATVASLKNLSISQENSFATAMPGIPIVRDNRPVRKPREEFLRSLNIGQNFNANLQLNDSCGRGRGRLMSMMEDKGNSSENLHGNAIKPGTSAGRGWGRQTSNSNIMKPGPRFN